MKLEFNTVDELIEFVEKMGYKKYDSNIEVDKKKDDWFTFNTTCPYGYVNCPFNKPVSPYNPYNPITVTYDNKEDNVDTPPVITDGYINTNLGTHQEYNPEFTTTSTSGKTTTINMKDISKKKK